MKNRHIIRLAFVLLIASTTAAGAQPLRGGLLEHGDPACSTENSTCLGDGRFEIQVRTNPQNLRSEPFERARHIAGPWLSLAWSEDWGQLSGLVVIDDRCPGGGDFAEVRISGATLAATEVLVLDHWTGHMRAYFNYLPLGDTGRWKTVPAVFIDPEALPCEETDR